VTACFCNNSGVQCMHDNAQQRLACAANGCNMSTCGAVTLVTHLHMQMHQARNTRWACSCGYLSSSSPADFQVSLQTQLHSPWLMHARTCKFASCRTLLLPTHSPHRILQMSTQGHTKQEYHAQATDRVRGRLTRMQKVGGTKYTDT
jgi:hypothetical protein